MKVFKVLGASILLAATSGAAYAAAQKLRDSQIVYYTDVRMDEVVGVTTYDRDGTSDHVGGISGYNSFEAFGC